MESIIRHLVVVVEEMEAGAEVLGVSIQDLVAYFYADEGNFASTKPGRLKKAFDVLSYRLNCFVIPTNTRKTVIIPCQPFHPTGSM